MFKSGSKFSGWYEAPAPWGRTDYTMTMETYNKDGSFTGRGQEKQGGFSARGTVSGTSFKMVKDFDNKSIVGIKYDGTVNNDTVSGNYSFLYQEPGFSKQVTQPFSMKLSN